MYEGLLERLKQTSVTTGMDFGGFRVVEPARPSNEIDSPRVLWNLSLASVLGLALGMCIAFARDFWDTSIATVEEVEQLTVLPVLGTLPLVQPAGSRGRGTSLVPLQWSRLEGMVRGVVARATGWPAGGAPAPADSNGRKASPGLIEPLVVGPALTPREDDKHPSASQRPLADDRLAQEGVRGICASILLSRSGRPPRVIMVTSAAPGEGKTTVVSGDRLRAR